MGLFFFFFLHCSWSVLFKDKLLLQCCKQYKCTRYNVSGTAGPVEWYLPIDITEIPLLCCVLYLFPLQCKIWFSIFVWCLQEALGSLGLTYIFITNLDSFQFAIYSHTVCVYMYRHTMVMYHHLLIHS